MSVETKNRDTKTQRVYDTKKVSDHADHTVTLRPGEQHQAVLHEYAANEQPKGFSIEFDPPPYPEHSVETQITSVAAGKHYKMILFVANYSTRTITATVRQL